MFALAMLGGADMVSVFTRQSLVQIATPDRMRGRVSAVATLFIGASNELGEFESGVAGPLARTGRRRGIRRRRRDGRDGPLGLAVPASPEGRSACLNGPMAGVSRPDSYRDGWSHPSSLR